MSAEGAIRRVAIVGAGRMGQPMARRLLAAGFEVVVSDVAPEPVAELCATGAERAEDPAAAAATTEVTITSLPTPAVVEDVLTGPRGVLTGAADGHVVLEMSTSSPSLARRLAAAGAERGVSVLDAPVSGGPPGATAGTLAVMVGGDADAFARVAPLLDELGGVVRHMGGPGSGQATKLTNNLLAATHMAVLAEAMAFANREGLDPKDVYEIVSSGTGDSRVLRNRFPVPGVLDHAPASNDWAALFPVDLLVKDVGLALEAAAEHGLSLPLVAAAQERYLLAVEAGYGALDYSAVARLDEREQQQ